MAIDRSLDWTSHLPSPSLAEDILHTLPSIVLVANGEGDIIYVSPSVERTLGYQAEDVLGDGWWQITAHSSPEKAHQLREMITRLARGQETPTSKPYKWHIRSRSGEVRCFLWHLGKGPGDLVIGTAQDITDLVHAEQQIEARSVEFRAIFDSASEGMLVLDSSWNCIDANSAAARIFGVEMETLIGTALGTWLGPHVDLSSVREHAMEKGSYTSEAVFSRPNGEKRHVEYSVNANFREDRHLTILRDITDRRALERQFAQAQKLEAVGRLAGGVAHDFNNMLTAIRGYGDLLLKKYPDGGHRRYVEGILNASDRAAQTTQQLLAFSRRQVMQPRLLDLNSAISDLLDLLQRLIGEDIELVTLLSEDAGSIMADPGQFGQILMNLAVNARDAMPGGGKLIIETRSVFLDDEYVLKHIQVDPGHYSMMAVTDTGTGIPSEVKAHIFEPFFTTKPQGMGSGLGLSTVYGIVKQSGGYIWLYSEPGEGTTFKIYFPRATEAMHDTKDENHSPRSILIIEDDELIRALSATVLREKGHFVAEAVDGTQALEICQATQRTFDLVITDIGAPGMSGEDLMGYFAVKYPNIAMIHISGFSKRYLDETHAIPENAVFLPKPFTARQLLEKVQQLLERRSVRE